MNRNWFYLWVGLLLLIIVSSILVDAKRSRPGRPATGADPQRLRLARETIRVWEESLAPSAASDHDLEDPSEEELLLRCQSALIRLREVETAMLGLGTKVRLVDDFQSWLSNGLSGRELKAASDYLDRLLEWLEFSRAGESSLALERLFLHPAVESPFPGLAIECSGDPETAGRSMRSLEGALEGWKLIELELIQPDPGAPWWIRGNMAYMMPN